MKKLIDKRIIIINAALLLLGLISGIIFLVFTSSLDKLIIKEEITSFFNEINTKGASLSNLFISFKYNFIYIFLITISSIIYLFSPLIPLINFYKGFLIGFLISSIVLTYKVKGFILAILSLIPHHLIICMLLIIYSSIMLHFSYKLISCTYKGENINLKAFIKKIGILFISALVICLIASLLEIYLNPLLVGLLL